jgi:hypothetical protein
MTDQSGAFPETLREAPWASLNDVVTAYVSDVAPPGGDSPRAIVLAAIDRLRAALERPRPAPPEPSATFTARQTLESEPCNYCGERTKVFFSLNPEATPDICPACFVTALGFAEPDAETFTLTPRVPHCECPSDHVGNQWHTQQCLEESGVPREETNHE